MLDETNNPQPTDPPTGTGGNTTVRVPDDDLTADAEALAGSEPPTGTGGNNGT
jgi:hypothetical protein